MIAQGSIRALLLALALAALPFAAPAHAESAYMKLTASDALDNRPVYLGMNKSIVIDLPQPAGDVLVSNPEVADAVLRTSTRLYLIGVKLGQASVFLFDQAGAQLASFDIYVEADLGSLNQILAEAIPDGYVRAHALNGSIILRGQVPSSGDAKRAVEIATSMLPAVLASMAEDSEEGGAGPSDPVAAGIVNMITITGEEQVAIKVTIAEVQREVVKQLGINTRAIIDDVITFANPINFPINTGNAGSEGILGIRSEDGDFSATVRALEETQMLRTLAEPTLTAVSGEPATFLAGGEFPVPVGGDEDEITVSFKPFGVNLSFTPIVLSQGRISLRVLTEVSDISARGAVSLPIGAGSVISIPAISVRRAETTVELPSGGAFVIAGLVQEDTRRAVSGWPWLQNLPILGALFSSKDFLQNQTELVMIVTAYAVKPVSPQALARPDQNLVMPGDAEAYFRNRLTKVYGAAAEVPAGAQAARVGFTFD